MTPTSHMMRACTFDDVPLVLERSTVTRCGVTESPSPCLTGWPGRTSISLPEFKRLHLLGFLLLDPACVRPTFAQSCDAYQLTGKSLTKRCVSWRKSNTVTGPWFGSAQLSDLPE